MPKSMTRITITRVMTTDSNWEMAFELCWSRSPPPWSGSGYGSPFAHISIIGIAGALIGIYPILKEAYENVMERRMTMKLSMAIAIWRLVATGFPKFQGGTGGYARYVAICPPDWKYGVSVGELSEAPMRKYDNSLHWTPRLELEYGEFGSPPTNSTKIRLPLATFQEFMQPIGSSIGVNHLFAVQ
jgi:hypothetical protein